ncbi:glycosyltransferase [uncultured Brevibacterium sp.]|uniref:glycosyltransferase n=1 Tax=uncultured Brevibacterium sp. TaxID=189678 RepID=UPI0025DF9D5C|nr:glycosyltransferase [uncultured Brevibacterium sp.]
MRVAVVGPSRLPIAPPFGGGLEVFVDRLVVGLAAAGVEVDLFAARGSNGHSTALEFPGVDWTGYEQHARDDEYPPGARESEAHAFAQLRDHLETADYDVIHNNSTHPALLFADPGRRAPMLTTLHVPPQRSIQSAIDRVGPDAGAFSAVSAFTAGQWRLPAPAPVIHNGVDTDRWPLGPGGRGAVWFGRLTREKGPHHAIDTCRRLGLPLTLIGRAAQPSYVEEEIRPRLGDDIRWLGTLSPDELAHEVGQADVALVTPEWDEPFGLVTIEALACGTPVAAFGRGGVPEVLADTPDHISRPSDPDDLARAVRAALRQSRAEARQIAVERFDLRIMIERYLEVFARLADGGPALPGPRPAVEYPRLAHRSRIDRITAQQRSARKSVR